MKDHNAASIQSLTRTNNLLYNQKDQQINKLQQALAKAKEDKFDYSFGNLKHLNKLWMQMKKESPSNAAIIQRLNLTTMNDLLLSDEEKTVQIRDIVEQWSLNEIQEEEDLQYLLESL